MQFSSEKKQHYSSYVFAANGFWHEEAAYIVLFGEL